MSACSVCQRKELRVEKEVKVALVTRNPKVLVDLRLSKDFLFEFLTATLIFTGAYSVILEGAKILLGDFEKRLSPPNPESRPEIKGVTSSTLTSRGFKRIDLLVFGNSVAGPKWKYGPQLMKRSRQPSVRSEINRN